MSAPAPIAICLLAEGAAPAAFRRCFWSILNHTPLDRIELRLGFSRATTSFHSALGALCPDNRWPQFDQLPGGVERFHWTARDGMRVLVWNCTIGVGRELLARLVYHDVPLGCDYAITLDQHCFVEAGWWHALLPLLERGTDYIGQSAWHVYRPGEADRVATCPWFMGVPLAHREAPRGWRSCARALWRCARRTCGSKISRSRDMRQTWRFSLARWPTSWAGATPFTIDTSS